MAHNCPECSMRADGICDAHRNTEIEKVGTIDTDGYLDGWYAKGFSFIKGLNELIANGIDPSVGSSEFEFHIEGQDIFMSDNGCGMDRNNVRNMFAMHRSNHSGDYSMGRSGIGGKIAGVILSAQGNIVMFTHKKNGEYLKIVVPWQKIFKEKNIKLIEIHVMDEEEIHLHFTSKHRESGTTYKFKHSNTLENTIEGAFIIPTDDSKEMNDMPCIVFGKSPVNITFKVEETCMSMPKYNYFGGTPEDYYVRKDYTIDVYENVEGDKKFALTMPDGIRYEPKYTKGVVCNSGKGIKEAIISDEFKLQARFDVVAGMRKNPDLIDNIKEHNLSTERHKEDEDYSIKKVNVPLAPYDRDFFGSEQNHERDAKPLLYRNGQFIGNLPYEGKISSIRGSWNNQVKGASIRIELSYNVKSIQTNYSDIMVGIQENKSQYNGRNIPDEIRKFLMVIRENVYVDVKQELASLLVAPGPAPSAPGPAPSAPGPAPSAPGPAPSAPGPAPSAPGPAPVDVTPTFVSPHFRVMPPDSQLEKIFKNIRENRPDSSDVLKAINLLYANMIVNK